MAYDPSDFLDKLAAWIATRAELEYAGTPRELWLHRADEASADMVKDAEDRPGTYSVLSLGVPATSVPPVGPAPASVLCLTLGYDTAATWARGTAIAQALLGEDGRPVWGIGPASDPPLVGYRLLGVTGLRGPYRGSQDAQGRVPVLISFDAPHVAV